ncbi:MAG: transcriptional regulator [Candidatus Buchananbacteria bacterium RBG_13_36_9]|uniref:Probable transcriptional regulatory protein A2Y82_00965 n=1 Tax=Candidatus Buchananbacteria bacterium RBG_13_36_9 TaxID=1797530 RepID=A0A1G1XND7_9BACT|nr:MAG: transcriptional regulator [Candidatus Buchananbacteria bacterium RBG_13_36_9]
MSGHSKWATTKRAKFATDAKRSNLFTKLARAITVAAREKGGDVSANFSLRLAMEKAKAANMPKDNIERAIKRGTGEIKGELIEELLYEGFGPGGTALIVKCLSDNKNRTAQEIKHILTRHGGSLGSPNSVAWQFEKKGVIRIEKEKLGGKNSEDLELHIIDLGAQDITIEDDALTIYTKTEDLQKVSSNLKTLGLESDYAEIEYVAKEKISLADDLLKKNQELFEALDDAEDVDNYYTNLKE